MKKNGFTLAEVLITLAIIGVVATMTLPALMNNANEQQYITGFKKGINTLTEAAQLSSAIDNIDYSNLATVETQGTTSIFDSNSPTLYALIASRVNIDPKVTGDRRGKDLKTDLNLGDGCKAGNFAIFFRDGAALYYPEDMDYDELKKRQDDGLVGGIKAVYDVNGAKGPNVLSNCNANTEGEEDTYEATTATDMYPRCKDAKQRVIGDQFGVRLRGNIAVPNGEAARWAFNK